MASPGKITVPVEVEFTGPGLALLGRIEEKLDRLLARDSDDDPGDDDPPEPPDHDDNGDDSDNGGGDDPPSGGDPASRHPSDVLPVLREWTIMLPTGSPGDPDNEYIVGKSIPGTYFVGDDGGVVFRVHPGTANHSKSSRYGRCEGRQMVPGKRWVKSAWSSSDPHRLFARLRIDASRLTHKIVNCCQIHDGSDDVIQVQLADGVLGVRHQDGKAWEVLDSNYRGGTFAVTVDVTGDGRIVVTYNGTHDKTVTIPKTGSGFYWKAGNYPNTGGANTNRPERADAFCDVVFYELAVDPK